MNTNISLLILRLTLGGVMFAHGAQKLFGWFGGGGFKASMNYFTGTVGVPYFLGVLIILGESLGAIALMLGFSTRFMALSLFVIMIGAMIVGHLGNGFYMNWYGNQKGEGIEFDILTFGLSLSLLVMGGGAWSLDNLISKAYPKTSLIF